MATRARIVRIGNSKGIRVPRALLEQARLREDVELYAEPGRLIVRPLESAREGWAAEARDVAAQHDLLDAPVVTHFDADEWEW